MKAKTKTYQQLIIEGIKGLPPEALAEVVDFIYFVRKRILEPQAFEEEIRNAILRIELRQLSRDEEVHLEKEFEAYEKLHPRK